MFLRPLKMWMAIFQKTPKATDDHYTINISFKVHQSREKTLISLKVAPLPNSDLITAMNVV